MDNIIKNLNNRYAVKKFDSSKTLANEQMNFIKEVLRLTPSSSGIQPWKFVFVKNIEIRKKLAQAAWNQPQITDCDTLIVLCANLDLENTTKSQVNLTKEVRNLDDSQVEGYSNMVMGQVKAIKEHSMEYTFGAEQCMIALGNLVSSCANAGIDCCPMGGFSKEAFDEILGLANLNLKSVVLCAVGVRSEDDPAANNAKVRFPLEKLIIEV